MKKHNYFYQFLFVLAFAVILLVYPHKVQANPQIVKLRTNKTYKSYDITGDKKKDTIKVKIHKNSRYDYYDSLTVTVNGKNAYSFKNQFFYAGPYDNVDIILYTLKNGKPFLYLYAQADNGDGPVCGVFQYKSGKLKEIINFQTFFKDYGIHQSGEVVTINGNSITVRYYVMSFALGPCYVTYNYLYKNGTLCRTSNTANFEKIYSYGKITNTFISNKMITAYTSVSAKRKAFTMKKGAIVQVDKCYCNGKSFLIRVKYKGKYGWIKAQKGYLDEKNRQFSNVTYAG